jgi:hypothetical protein
VVDRGVAEPGRHAAGLPEALRGEVLIRRTSTGWRVEGPFPGVPTDTVDDLGHALTLADLLAEGTVPGPRPPRPADGLDEVTKLRASVRQLEHALASRVIVEQAIGVLSERWRCAPRDAFEQLRRVTRSHGLRIHDLAKLVIESSTDAAIGLPAELVPAQRAGGGSTGSPDAAGSPSAGPPSEGPPSAGSPSAGAPTSGSPPEPRQAPDARGRESGERRRTRRPDPAPSNGRVAPLPATPAPRVPQHGRHARADR